MALTSLGASPFATSAIGVRGTMVPEDNAEQSPTTPTEWVHEYLRLREAGDPDAAKRVLARCRGFVRREVEESIAVYEELEDIGRLARDEDPNPPGRTE